MILDRLTESGFDFDMDFVASHLQSWPIAQALKKLQQYEDAEESGRLVMLPEVSESTRKLFAENLKDVFDDWANYDPSVGIFGMSDGEAALASALMRGLESVKV